jgi:hypothetical protein
MKNSIEAMDVDANYKTLLNKSIIIPAPRQDNTYLISKLQEGLAFDELSCFKKTLNQQLFVRHIEISK